MIKSEEFLEKWHDYRVTTNDCQLISHNRNFKYFLSAMCYRYFCKINPSWNLLDLKLAESLFWLSQTEKCLALLNNLKCQLTQDGYVDESLDLLIEYLRFKKGKRS